MRAHRHRSPIFALALPAAALATPILAPAAMAHAFLDHAVPGVGAIVSASPGELTLSFTQQVVVALSSITLAGAGSAVATGRAAGEGGSSSETLHVRLARALPPGTYTVTWRVVSVDTHPTSGSFRFTVAP